MTYRAHLQEAVQRATGTMRTTPATFLNAYEIVNAASLSWPVNIYAVDLKGAEPQGHDQRGLVKGIVWDLKGKHWRLCKGDNLVVDISPRLVAVPASWKFPVPIDSSDYFLSLERCYSAKATDNGDRLIVEGILREAFKNRFKNVNSPELGPLWQDYNAFCQYPATSGDEYLMCRRFACTAKKLRGGVWVLQIAITTAAIDGRTFEDYYLSGRVDLLAQMLEAKRRDRVDRDNRPITLRVLRQYQVGSSKVETIDLEDFDVVQQHGRFSPQQQRALATSEIKCRPFKKPLVGVPLRELRLILDSQITQEEHSETIIEPAEREALMHQVRQFMDAVEASGHVIQLSEEPFDADRLEQTFFLPPAVRVRSAGGGQTVLPAPNQVTEEAVRSRGRDRLNYIRKNGFLERRPIFPVLAWPEERGRKGGASMKEDLELIWKDQGIEASLKLVYYSQVDDIRRALEDGPENAVLAVLPELSSMPRHLDTTHENIKRKLEAPSQCINIDHTKPKHCLNQPLEQLRRTDPRLAKRLRNTYEMCLGSLLVKHHWFPFAPASPFHYNVQVGLDVGGVHNTAAMACLGYGFSRPSEVLIFRPEEIPIAVQKKEPIPTEWLFSGLLRLFEFVQSEISSEGFRPDYERVVFYRDGKLLGAGGEWNEVDALRHLHQELAKREWVTRESVWTAVEVLKAAEGWRVFRNGGRIENPLVGRCIFPYDDEQTALVCTTGAPYLSQGTAQPLIARIIDISGRCNRDEVLQDLVWQCDMCFTKPDIGLSLPWVLHVADKGALQLSRSYRISGLTA
jgi:hypothetical protein